MFRNQFLIHSATEIFEARDLKYLTNGGSIHKHLIEGPDAKALIAKKKKKWIPFRPQKNWAPFCHENYGLTP